MKHELNVCQQRCLLVNNNKVSLAMYCSQKYQADSFDHELILDDTGHSLAILTNAFQCKRN